MSLERGSQPEYTFPWQMDAEGYYIAVKTNLGVFALRHTNTMIYSFPVQQEMNHIYRETERTDTESRGVFIWSHLLPGFNKLCIEMRERGFTEIVDEPCDSDYDAYVQLHTSDLNALDEVPEDWIE